MCTVLFIRNQLKYCAVIASLSALPDGQYNVMGSVYQGGVSGLVVALALFLQWLYCAVLHMQSLSRMLSVVTLSGHIDNKNCAFRMPKVFSILTLVLLWAMLNCCWGLVSGKGVIKNL